MCLLWDLTTASIVNESIHTAEQSHIKRSSGWIRHHADLQLTLQSGLVNKGWQHVSNKSSKRGRGTRSKGAQTLTYTNMFGVKFFCFAAASVGLPARHVWVLLCVQTRSLMPGLYSFQAQSGTHLLSLQRSCNPRSLWLIALVLSDWPAFSLQGKIGQSGVGLQRAVLFTRCLTRVISDWKVKENMLLILFISWIRPDWTHSGQLFIHHSDALGASSHVLCVSMMLSDVAVVQPTGRGAARVLFAPNRRTCCTQTS